MRTLSVLALAALSTAAVAKVPVLHVSGWARATVPAQTGSVAYLTIRNSGSAADRLLAVSTSAAANASLHNTDMSGGVMRMRPAGPVNVAAGRMVQMKSGGLHIMLTGLKAPLKSGQQLPLTLTFQRAGTLRVSVPISMRAPDGGHRH